VEGQGRLAAGALPDGGRPQRRQGVPDAGGDQARQRDFAG